MQQIKFSILIPVYNVENFIRDCVDSVLNQTYQKFEIILVDDGSTDMSGIICDEYAANDNRIKVNHQTNQGLIMARRNAITKASGDFCLFLDSDDYWDGNLLEIINENICKYDCDLVIFKYKKVSEKGIYIADADSYFKDKIVFTEENKEQLFKEIISTYNLNNLVCKAIKRNIIDVDMNYSMFREIRNGEDLLQSLPLLFNAKKIMYIDKAIYNYRIRPASITQNCNNHFIEDVTIVRSAVLDYLVKCKADKMENLKLFYSYYVKIILNYIPQLINSNSAKEKKLEILNRIKNLQLYIDAVNYTDSFKFSLKQRNIFYLFSKKHYGILFVYVKIISLTKRIIKYFLLE